jgi:hypothetical protein
MSKEIYSGGMLLGGLRFLQRFGLFFNKRELTILFWVLLLYLAF